MLTRTSREGILMRYLRMGTGQGKKTKGMIRYLGALSHCTTSLNSRGNGGWVQTPGQRFNQSCLHKEASLKIQDTKAQMSFLSWQYSLNTLMSGGYRIWSVTSVSLANYRNLGGFAELLNLKLMLEVLGRLGDLEDCALNPKFG